MAKEHSIPEEFQYTKQAALRAISPIQPVNSRTVARPDFLLTAQRSAAGRDLPEYYFVYFLLVDLLGFQDLGRIEKVAWSVPIDFHGRGFLIEHRKFGIGVFVQDPLEDEEAAGQIVLRIQKAVKIARPFYDWLAIQAVNKSALNVNNNTIPLYNRYKYFKDAYQNKIKEAEDHENQRITEEEQQPYSKVRILKYPAFQLRKEAQWQALATIEAFFSWTEHIFIHIAILSGKCSSAKEISQLASADWSTKFKAAFDLNDIKNKTFYDQLITIRKGLRNFIAHGAFGKNGEAFYFHSGAGAVPVLLPDDIEGEKFVMGGGLVQGEENAIKFIDEFISYLWSGERKPAEIYIQQSGLEVILPMVIDGTYKRAMTSPEAMEDLVNRLEWESTNAANMDW